MPRNKYREARKGLWWDYKKTDPNRISFTRSKDNKSLYAMTFGWPKSSKLIIGILKQGSQYMADDINNVELLGSKEEKYKRTSGGLEIIFPKQKSCEVANTHKTKKLSHSLLIATKNQRFYSRNGGKLILAGYTIKL